MKRMMIGLLFLAVAANAFAYYMPEQGRWANRDPMQPNWLEPNVYGLVNNDPINSWDYLGREGGFAYFNEVGNVLRNEPLGPFPNGLTPEQESFARTSLELVIPMSALGAISEGRYAAVAGEYVVGKVKILKPLSKVPGVEALTSKCCVKVKAVIEWFNKPLRKGGGEAIEKCSTSAGPTVTLHHNGSLVPSGQVNPNRSLSTSRSSDIGHYHSNEPIQTFEVPQDKFVEWTKKHQVEFYKDVKAGTDKVVEEIRILPPASGELNKFKK